MQGFLNRNTPKKHTEFSKPEPLSGYLYRIKASNKNTEQSLPVPIVNIGLQLRDLDSESTNKINLQTNNIITSPYVLSQAKMQDVLENNGTCSLTEVNTWPHKSENIKVLEPHFKEIRLNNYEKIEILGTSFSIPPYMKSRFQNRSLNSNRGQNKFDAVDNKRQQENFLKKDSPLPYRENQWYLPYGHEVTLFPLNKYTLSTHLYSTLMKSEHKIETTPMKDLLESKYSEKNDGTYSKEK